MVLVWDGKLNNSAPFYFPFTYHQRPTQTCRVSAVALLAVWWMQWFCYFFLFALCSFNSFALDGSSYIFSRRCSIISIANLNSSTDGCANSWRASLPKNLCSCSMSAFDFVRIVFSARPAILPWRFDFLTVFVMPLLSVTSISPFLIFFSEQIPSIT